MPIQENIRIEGLRATFAALEELRGSTQRKLVAKAQRKTLRPMVKEVRKAAPRGSYAGRGRRSRGNLQKSITMTKTKKYQSGVVWTAIGSRFSFTATGRGGRLERPARYAHFTESGSIYQKAQRWMKKWTRRNNTRISTGFGRELGTAIEDETVRIRARTRHKG